MPVQGIETLVDERQVSTRWIGGIETVERMTSWKGRIARRVTFRAPDREMVFDSAGEFVCERPRLRASQAERYRSGQTGQTVNLLDHSFGGSNPPLSTTMLISEPVVEREFEPETGQEIEKVEKSRGFGSAGIAQLARARAFQARGRGFESRFPLHPWDEKNRTRCVGRARTVEVERTERSHERPVSRPRGERPT